MRTLKINPKNYNFLWLVNNQTYFFTSFWLHQEYLKYDFFITYKNNEWKTYLGEKDRLKLAGLGLQFFKNNFPQYCIKVKNNIRQAIDFFDKLYQKKLSSMSNPELEKDFLKTIKFVQSLWRLYFFTEYFIYDKVEKATEKNTNLLRKVQKMGNLKLQLREQLNKTIFKGNVFEKYFKEIEKRTGRKDLYSLSYREIADLLAGKRIAKINRQNYIWGKFNNWQPIVGKEALKIIKIFDDYALKKTKQKNEQKNFKGQIANKGFYRGRVKIIPFDLQKNLNKEISKMKKGDVLVSGSTGPEMILACKKAGAIITEEGGILSHAAVISRELDIPCIIGTKIATKILKDNDLVEVDAIKGEVRILN